MLFPKDIDDVTVLKSAILGFEVEFKSRKNIDNVASSISDSLGEDIDVQPINKYKNGFEKIALREKWGRTGVHYEVVTKPLEYDKAVDILEDILNWISDQTSAQTDKSTGLHINISFDDRNIRFSFDPLKFALEFDENKIFQELDNSRFKSFYSRSIFDQLLIDPNIDMSDDKGNIIDKIRLSLGETRALNTDKLNDEYLEFKYIGGENYHTDVDKVKEFVEEIVLAVAHSDKHKFDQSDRKKLLDRISDDIEKAKAFKNYESFKENYPNVELTVDLSSRTQKLKTHFQRIKERLRKVLPYPGRSIMDVNYDSDLNKIQIKNAYLMDVMNCENVDFFDSTLRGVFSNCYFKGCEIRNSRIYDGSVIGGSLSDTKLTDSNIMKYTDISRCMLQRSESYSSPNKRSLVLNSDLKEKAEADSTTRVINEDE